jgi:hypothetical protein
MRKIRHMTGLLLLFLSAMAVEGCESIIYPALMMILGLLMLEDLLGKEIE